MNSSKIFAALALLGVGFFLLKIIGLAIAASALFSKRYWPLFVAVPFLVVGAILMMDYQKFTHALSVVGGRTELSVRNEIPSDLPIGVTVSLMVNLNTTDDFLNQPEIPGVLTAIYDLRDDCSFEHVGWIQGDRWWTLQQTIDRATPVNIDQCSFSTVQVDVRRVDPRRMGTIGASLIASISEVLNPSSSNNTQVLQIVDAYGPNGLRGAARTVEAGWPSEFTLQNEVVPALFLSVIAIAIFFLSNWLGFAQWLRKPDDPSGTLDT
ncbi:hypothetical protein [Halocynthiibacter sp.]|uniref:hypothetical protein n=1 Tax=Halocynthiibacter sp. TaxID=1979210 RepID=UPI003C6104C5